MIKMKNIIIIIITILFFSQYANAAEISGDVSAEYSARTINNSSFLNPDNINNENSAAYIIKGSLILKNEFNENSNGMIKLEAKYAPAEYREEDIGEEIYIKEMYIDLLVNYFSLRAGKQFLKWGDCVFFNPADVVNISRDPLRPVNEAEGSPFIQLSVPVYSFASFDFLGIVREDKTEKSADIPVFAKFSASGGNLSGFVYMMKERSNNPVTGFDLSFVATLTSETSVSLYSEGYYKTESDRKYINNELSVTTRKQNQYFGAAGGFRMNMNFPSLKRLDKVEFIAEYYYDNENFSSHEFDNLAAGCKANLDLARYYIPFKSAQQYGYANISIENFIFYQLTFSAGCVLNIPDKSTILVPSFQYKYSDNCDLETRGAIYNGKNNSEFGNAIAKWSMTFFAHVFF
jgi:hypothetical protein